MAFPQEVISVTEFEKLINSNELVEILRGFGLIEPISNIVQETPVNSFNTIFSTRFGLSNLVNDSKKYRVKIGDKEEASIAELPFLLYTLIILINVF